MQDHHAKGLLFADDLHREIRNRFLHVDSDPEAGERVFFENAGGSLRLKAVNKAFAEADAFPDCDSRKHKRAKWLRNKTLQGFADLRVMFNADPYDQIIWETASSKVMFTMVRAVLENIPGGNVVMTELEHPSVFDSMTYYARRHGLEIRVAQPNRTTGGVDIETIAALVDEGTVCLNCIAASNITGAILDIEAIVKACRAKKPDLYILVDAVQHAPHGLLDVKKWGADGVNFAAYKIFGCRGFGAGWLSRRLAMLDHQNIAGNLGDPWEIGGPAPAMLASVSEIVNHVCWIGSKFVQSDDRRTLWEAGMTHIELHERALLDHTLCGGNGVVGLRDMKNVRVHFDTSDLTRRDFIMAVTFDNINYTDAVNEFQNRGVIVYDRNDSSYFSVRCLHPFGLDGVIRVSPLHCHNIRDIQKFLKACEEIAALR